MSDELPEDVRAAFAAVQDRFTRGGVPNVTRGDSDPVLLEDSARRLEQIEAAGRPSPTLWSRTGTTTGGSGVYAAADSYQVPFIAHSITIMVHDDKGAYVQLANDINAEWALDEMHLPGPAAYPFPAVRVTSIRIRALDYADQATYTLVATESTEPLRVATMDGPGSSLSKLVLLMELLTDTHVSSTDAASAEVS